MKKIELWRERRFGHFRHWLAEATYNVLDFWCIQFDGRCLWSTRPGLWIIRVLDPWLTWEESEPGGGARLV